MGIRDPRLGGLPLITLRDAIVDFLRARFPDGAVPTIEKHRGKWTHESIDRYSRSTPAILVAYTAAHGFETTGAGSSRGRVTWSAYIMTDSRDGDADDASLALTGDLLTILPGSSFSDPTDSASEDASGINAYVDDLEDKGIDVHVVSWTQEVEFPKLTASELAALPDFLRLFTTYEMGGDADPDPEHLNNVREP